MARKRDAKEHYIKSRQELGRIIGKNAKQIKEFEAKGMPIERTGPNGGSFRVPIKPVFEWFRDSEIPGTTELANLIALRYPKVIMEGPVETDGLYAKTGYPEIDCLNLEFDENQRKIKAWYTAHQAAEEVTEYLSRKKKLVSDDLLREVVRVGIQAMDETLSREQSEVWLRQDKITDEELIPETLERMKSKYQFLLTQIGAV